MQHVVIEVRVLLRGLDDILPAAAFADELNGPLLRRSGMVDQPVTGRRRGAAKEHNVHGPPLRTGFERQVQFKGCINVGGGFDGRFPGFGVRRRRCLLFLRGVHDAPQDKTQCLLFRRCLTLRGWFCRQCRLNPGAEKVFRGYLKLAGFYLPGGIVREIAIDKILAEENRPDRGTVLVYKFP